MSNRHSTEPQDRPNTGRRALLTGGAISLAAVAGAALGEAQPASAATQAVQMVEPTGDTSGMKDTMNIQTALNAGIAILDTQAGHFYIGTMGSSATGVTVTSPGGWLAGNSGDHQVYYLGKGIGISMHGGGVPYPPNVLGGKITDLVVDGTSAGDGAVGIDFGDGDDITIDNVRVANFTGTGSIGIREINRAGYTEKSRIRVQLFNNTIGYVFKDTGSPVTHSHWYSSHDLHFNAYSGQNGVQFLSGSGIHNAQDFRIRGNFNTTTPGGGAGSGTGVVLDFSASTGHVDTSFVVIAVEIDGPTGNYGWQTIKFGANGAMLGNVGKISFTSGQTTFAQSDVAQGQFSFAGSINGDSNLTTNNNPAPGSVPGMASISANPANPLATTSTTRVMMGLNIPFTPTGSGKVLITVTGTAQTATAAAAITLSGQVGTGNPPGNGVPVSGNRFGGASNQTLGPATAAAAGIGFAVTDIVTFTPGTGHWVDLALATGSAADAASVASLSVTLTELPS
jgi:hypothetical protein